jgi:energy-coupling factor transporter transmembrane protein EcfT
MHTSPELVREHTRAKLEQAQRARYARTVMQIRKVRRMEQRAERQLLRAWQRGEELRASLETR